MDVHEPEVRSYNMSQIKGKNTKPEILVRKFLFSKGFRYWIHVKTLPGTPDIVLKKYKKIIVDIRGCFWHGHKNCKYGDKVKSDSEIVTGKVRSAIVRDKRNAKILKRMGWKVFLLWDSCQLESRKKSSLRRSKVLNTLVKEIRKHG